MDCPDCGEVVWIVGVIGEDGSPTSEYYCDTCKRYLIIDDDGTVW